MERKPPYAIIKITSYRGKGTRMTWRNLVKVILLFMINISFVYSWNVKLSVVVPADDQWLFSMKRVAPAIQIAIDSLSDNYDLQNLSFSVKYADSQCETAEAMNEAIKLFIKKEVHAFFGPVCDYAVAPVARQVTFWNMPLISVGAMARDFVTSRRTEYPLLIRAGPVNFNTLSSFFVENFKFSKWDKFKILYYQLGHSDVFDPFCHLAVKAIHYDIKDKAPSIKQDYFRLDDTSESYLRKTLLAEVGLSYGGGIPVNNAVLVNNRSKKDLELSLVDIYGLVNSFGLVNNLKNWSLMNNAVLVNNRSKKDLELSLIDSYVMVNSFGLVNNINWGLMNSAVMLNNGVPENNLA